MSQFKYRLQSIFNDAFNTPSTQKDKWEANILDLTTETLCALSSKLKRNMSGRLKINDYSANSTNTPQKVINTTITYNETSNDFITTQCNTNKIIRNFSFKKLQKSSSNGNINLYSPSRAFYSNSKKKLNTSLRHLSKEINGNTNNHPTDCRDKQIISLRKDKKNYLSKTSLLLQNEIAPSSTYQYNYQQYSERKNSNTIVQVANNNSFLRTDRGSQITDFRKKSKNNIRKPYLNY